MKKLIAVFLCVVLFAAMIPSFFASAATLPAAAQEVVAQEESTDMQGLYDAIKGAIELWGGLLKLILGSEIIQNFLPALKQVLSITSLQDFFSTIGSIWSDVTGG